MTQTDHHTDAPRDTFPAGGISWLAGFRRALDRLWVMALRAPLLAGESDRERPHDIGLFDGRDVILNRSQQPVAPPQRGRS